MATTEVHDHEGVNARLKKLAETAGISVSSELDSRFQQRLAKLTATQASDFDRAYLEDMKQIHDNDEKVFGKKNHAGRRCF